jgi:hypothetical protein
MRKMLVAAPRGRAAVARAQLVERQRALIERTRATTRQLSRGGRIRAGDPLPAPPRWCDRAGSPPSGSHAIRAANRRLPQADADWLATAAEREVEASPEPVGNVTFAAAAAAWLEEREPVAGWTPTTARNMRRYLRHPGDEPDARGTKPKARIMTAFAETAVEDISADDLRNLRELDREPDLAPGPSTPTCRGR